MPTSKPSRLDVEIDGQPYKLFIPGAGNQPTAMGGHPELPPEIYNVEEVDPLLSRLGSGDQLNYGDFPPAVESVIAQDDWSTGLAPLRHDLGGKITGSFWTGLGVDARRPHQLILQPAATAVTFATQPATGPVRFQDYKGSFYCIAGATVWKFTAGAWANQLNSGGANFSDLQVYGNPTASYLMACNGANYWTTTDGAAWTQAGGSGDQLAADFLMAIRNVLWKAVKPNKLYSTTTPLAPAGWTSTPIYVGDASQSITSLAPYKIDLAIGKTDGLWTVDRAGNDFPILPELRTVTDAGNCVNMKSWRNGLNFRVRNGFWRYLGTKLESIGLDRYRTAGVAGAQITLQPVDQAPYLNEVFVVHQPSTGTGIYLASLMEDSTTTWKWHLPFYQATALPTACAVSGAAFAYPSLWIGRKTGGTFDTFNLRLPAATDNPLDDSAYSYDTGASNRLTTMEFSPLPEQDKHWQKLVVHMLQGTSTQTLAVGYAPDGAIDTATFTPMLGLEGQTTQFGLYQEWFFPGPVSSKSVQFQLTLATSSALATPVVKHVVLHFKHRPVPRKRWKLHLVAEDKAAGGAHYLDRRSAEQVVRQLQQARQAASPLSFVDLLGDSYQITMEKVSHRLVEKLPQGQRRYVVMIEMLEVIGTSTPVLPPALTG